MHYLTQTIAILLTLFILIIWFAHKKTGDEKESIFINLLFIALLLEFVDILTQFAIAPFPLENSDLFTLIVIKIYLILIIAYFPFACLYLMKYFDDSINLNIYKKKIFALIGISALIVAVIPISFAYHSDCSYPTGFGVFFTLIVVVAIWLFTSIAILKRRKQTTDWILVLGIIWIATFAFGVIFQFATVQEIHFPVISINIAVGLMFLYLCIENPGSKYDYDTECFYYDTFIVSVRESLNHQEDISCMMINLKVKNLDNLVYIDSIYKKLSKEYSKKSIRLFNGVSNEMYILSNDYSDIKELKNFILMSISAQENNNAKVKIYSSFVIVPSLKVVESYKTLKYIFDLYKANNSVATNTIDEVIVDDSMANDFKKRISTLEDVDFALKNGNCDINYRLIKNINDNKIYAEAFADLIVNENKILHTSDYYETAIRYDRLKDVREIKLQKMKNDIYSILNKDNNLETIFVHTSVQELELDDYYDEFSYAFDSNKKVLSKLCLVIYNIDTISNKEVLLKNINELQKFDVKFAISGFGSGESNLNYFIDLPIHFVIFDKDVLYRIKDDSSTLNIITDITDLARSLNYGVIAVYDNENVDIVKSLSNINMFLNESEELMNSSEFIDYTIKGGKQ